MFNNSDDLLNIALTIFVVLLGFLLAVLVLYLIFVVRDVSKMTKKVEKTIKEPLGWLEAMLVKISPVITAFMGVDKNDESREK